MNINGTAIPSALHILCWRTYLPLNDKNKAELRNRYSKVVLVSIDKKSMVSNKLLCQIHKSLSETFTPTQDILLVKNPFWSVDFHRISPVRAKSVFMFGEPELTEGFINRDLRRKFELVELDQLMQQKDDTIFVELLTKT